MLKDLTYRVVVIDDEEDLYEDYVEHIENKLSSEGYIIEHKRLEEIDELDDYPLKEVDLFLVDLKFGKEDKGPVFIRKIRENYLTDILFYSSDATAIQDYRKSGEFQGVFFAIRDENTTEIIDMIDQLIVKMVKRSNTPISTRGIVLGCVAELDNIIKEKIGALSACVDQSTQKDLLDSCTKVFFDSYKGQAKRIGEFWGCDFHTGIKEWKDIKAAYLDFQLTDLVNNVRVTDSNKNLQVLLKTYKKLKGKDELYDAILGFSELLNDRNVFAHVQEELDADGNYRFKKLIGDDYLILTEEKCRELRSEIIEQFKNISRLS